MPRPSYDDPIDENDFADLPDPDLAAAGEDDTDEGDFEDFDPEEDDAEEE